MRGGRDAQAMSLIFKRRQKLVCGISGGYPQCVATLLQILPTARGACDGEDARDRWS
jgi:hypothetical protein